jgi:ribosomal protein L40E
MLLVPPSMSFMVPEVSGQVKETVCSAFDRLCDEKPEHYVERYITEPDYKAWFDRNFPDYTIYEGIGITESQYQKIVNQLTKPQLVAEQKVTVQTSSGGNEIIYVLVAAVAVGGGIGAIFIIKKGSKSPKTVQQESPSRRQTTVLFCGKCGVTLIPGARFCGKCGNPQS